MPASLVDFLFDFELHSRDRYAFSISFSRGVGSPRLIDQSKPGLELKVKGSAHLAPGSLLLLSKAGSSTSIEQPALQTTMYL